MEKQIFKVGDKVFDYSYGWGKVLEILNRAEYSYAIVVGFNKDYFEKHRYSNLGIEMRRYHPTLSFTEYSLEGFSQERPINYDDYIGKWGKFWDDSKRIIVVGKLINYLPHLVCAFEMKTRKQYVMKIFNS